MRQRPLSVVVASVLAGTLASTLLLGCGDDTVTPDATTETTKAGDTPLAPEWTKPSVSIPDALPTELVVTTLRAGAGPAAVKGSTVIVHYVGVRSATGQEFDNSYDRGAPFPVVLGTGQVIQGWDEGLIGVQPGQRLQLDIPADLAYGDEAPGGAIQAGDALTFVIDVVTVLPGSTADEAPDLTIDPRDNIAELAVDDLVVGTGAPVAEGEHAAIQIVVFRADTGEILESSWGNSPMTFTVSDQTEIFPIFAEAVRGMKVGGRRLAQMPFAEVWDGAGNEDLGLPAGLDIVVAIDLVGSF